MALDLPRRLECAATLEGHEERVWHAAWSPDGKFLASCGSDRTVRVWQESAPDAWVAVSVLDDAHERTVRSCAWSPCGNLLACVSFDATCCVWRRSDGGVPGDASDGSMPWDLVATLEGHENEVKAACWNASGTLLATCGRDKSVWLWEYGDDDAFEVASVCHGHGGDVKAACFDCCSVLADDDLLASASYDDTIKLWGDDGDDWSCRATLGGFSSTVWDVRFAAAPDGARRLVACGADRAVRVYVEAAPREWVLSAALEGAHARAIYSCDAAPDGRGGQLIATGGGDDRLAVSVYGAAPAAALATVAVEDKAHAGDVNSARFHPKDASILATAGDDATVKVWRLV